MDRQVQRRNHFILNTYLQRLSLFPRPRWSPEDKWWIQNLSSPYLWTFSKYCSWTVNVRMNNGISQTPTRLLYPGQRWQKFVHPAWHADHRPWQVWPLDRWSASGVDKRRRLVNWFGGKIHNYPNFKSSVGTNGMID